MSDQSTNTPPATEAPAEGQAPAQQATHQPANDIGSQLQSLIQAEAQKRQHEADAAKRQRAEQQAYELIELAKRDPTRFVQAVGGDVSALMPQQPKNNVSAVQEQLEELRGQLAQREEREQTFYRQAQMEQLRRGVRTYVESQEEFPLTKATGNADAVYDTLVSYHNAGQSISEEEAARQVESRLEELVEKAMQLEAFRKKYGSAAAPPQQSTLSLSNLDAPRVTDGNPGRPLSRQERQQELMAALRFTDD